MASLAQSYLDKDSEREYVEEDAVMSEGGGSSSPSATAAGERTEAARTLATELQPAPLSGRLGSSATEMGLKLSFDLAEPGPRPEKECALGLVHIGLVRVQYKGKGSFNDALVSLDIVSDDGAGTLPQLSFKSKDDGSLLRTAAVAGCTVSSPKKARKGQGQHAFRLDLSSKDSKGDLKYVIAAETHAELTQWTDSLRLVAGEASSSNSSSSTTDRMRSQTV